VNKRWRNAGLYALLVVVVIAIATALFDNSGQEAESWRYSRFLDAVQNNTIERVSISADRSRARFTAPDGSGQVTVNLPNDPDLISTLESNNVDIVVYPQGTMRGRWCACLAPS
jgi:cell division protease FtsH